MIGEEEGGWDPRLRAALALGLAVLVVVVAFGYARRLADGKSAFVRWQPQVRALLRGEDVYREYAYPNPPLMGLLLAPLAALPVEAGAWLLFALKVLLAGVAVAWALGAVAPRGPPLAAPWAVLGIVLSLRPIMSDLQHGNVNILIFFLVIAGLHALQRGRDVSAGLLVGFATCLKITPALLLAYFAWKRWWRGCAAFCVALGVLTLAPGLVLGFGHTLDLLVSYYQVMLEPFSVEGTVTASRAANQSLGAVLQRHLTDLPSLDLPAGPARFNWAALDEDTVRGLLRAISLGLVIALAWLCRSPGDRRGLRVASEYALVLIAMLVISPRSWKHHYVVMALPYFCLLAWAARPDFRAWRRWLWGTILLSQLLVLSTSHDVAKIVWFVDDAHDWAQALGAYLFSAVVVAIALAAVLRSAGRREGGAPPSRSPVSPMRGAPRGREVPAMPLRSHALAIVTVVTLLGASAPAGAEEPWHSVYRSDHRDWTLSLTGGFALFALDGNATIDESQGDTDVSLDGTLDLDDFETFWGEADLQLFRGQHLRFAYTPMRFDGSDSLATAIVVDGVTYDPGDEVDSKLKLDQYELSFRSEIWLGEYVNLAPLVQVSLVDAEVEIENETQLLSEKESAWLPLPYLGLRAEVFPIPRLQLFAEGKGFTIGSPGTIWDVSGGLALHLTRNFSLLGRYRVSDYAVEWSDSEIDLSVAGPQLGATLRF